MTRLVHDITVLDGISTVACAITKPTLNWYLSSNDDFLRENWLVARVVVLFHEWMQCASLPSNITFIANIRPAALENLVYSPSSNQFEISTFIAGRSPWPDPDQGRHIVAPVHMSVSMSSKPLPPHLACVLWWVVGFPTCFLHSCAIYALSCAVGHSRWALRFVFNEVCLVLSRLALALHDLWHVYIRHPGHSLGPQSDCVNPESRNS